MGARSEPVREQRFLWVGSLDCQSKLRALQSSFIQAACFYLLAYFSCTETENYHISNHKRFSTWMELFPWLKQERRKSKGRLKKQKFCFSVSLVKNVRRKQCLHKKNVALGGENSFKYGRLGWEKCQNETYTYRQGLQNFIKKWWMLHLALSSTFLLWKHFVFSF